jgi:hypothetical protein
LMAMAVRLNAARRARLSSDHHTGTGYHDPSGYGVDRGSGSQTTAPQENRRQLNRGRFYGFGVRAQDQGPGPVRFFVRPGP